MSERDKALLQTLRNADVALYKLWRQLPINGEFVAALNELQKKFIHPAIRATEQKGAQG